MLAVGRALKCETTSHSRLSSRLSLRFAVFISSTTHGASMTVNPLTCLASLRKSPFHPMIGYTPYFANANSNLCRTTSLEGEGTGKNLRRRRFLAAHVAQPSEFPTPYCQRTY